MTHSKRILAWLLVLVLALSLTACGSSASSSSEEASVPESSAPETSLPESSAEPSLPEPTMARNPLTGQYDLDPALEGTRPAAIMINNITAARPQHNITGADLYYEMVVEGGITRIMAMFSDYSAIPMTGSIRSARPSYVQLACGHDAIFVHVGGSDDAYGLLRSLSMQDVDGVSEWVWRDPGRRAEFGSVHSCVTDGEHLTDAVERRGFRTEIKPDANQFVFVEPGEEHAFPADSGAVNSVTVEFSRSYISIFDYDEETKTYLKSNAGGEPHVDYGTDEQVAVSNVLLLETPIRNSGNAVGHMIIDMEGGKGSYFSHGKMESITWKKGADTAPLCLYGADGQPLKLNCGKSWICFVNSVDQIGAE